MSPLLYVTPTKRHYFPSLLEFLEDSWTRSMTRLRLKKKMHVCVWGVGWGRFSFACSVFYDKKDSPNQVSLRQTNKITNLKLGFFTLVHCLLSRKFVVINTTYCSKRSFHVHDYAIATLLRQWFFNSQSINHFVFQFTSSAHLSKWTFFFFFF